MKADKPLKPEEIRRSRRPRPTGRLRNCLREMNILLSKNNHLRSNGRIASFATRYRRSQFFEKSLRQLHAGGYKLLTPQGLRAKHLWFLFDLWLDKPLAASTIATNLSNLRLFEQWIEKPGLTNTAINSYWRREELMQSKQRTNVARESKSWTAKGVNPHEVIAEIEMDDPRIATQMRLMLAFGLRRTEAWLLRPHVADGGGVLHVLWGTKGGRPRSTVPIETEFQSRVLADAKRFADNTNASMIPRSYTEKHWKSYYERMMRKHGVTKADRGVTSHDLRHEYAQVRYERLLAEEQTRPPELRNHPDIRPKRQLSEELGHSRERITSCYLGPAKAPLVALESDEEGEEDENSAKNAGEGSPEGQENDN